MRLKKEKFDLRRIHEHPYPIKDETLNDLREYLRAIFPDDRKIMFNPEEKTIRVYGHDQHGFERDSGTHDIKDYVKEVRAFYEGSLKEEVYRERLNLPDQFEKAPMPIHLDNIFHGPRGLKSRNKSIEKRLSRDPETYLNPLQEQARNLDRLRYAKVESFANPDEIMKMSGVDVTKYKKYNKALNQWVYKSEASKRKYATIFSEILVDEFEEYEGQFFGFIYNHAERLGIDRDATLKSQLDGMDNEEYQRLIDAYIVESVEYAGEKEWAKGKTQGEWTKEKLLKLRRNIK